MGNFTPAVIAAAQKSQKDWGVPASVSLAQWALESAYGTKLSAPFNPFGIKAVGGQKAGTPVPTKEVINGKTITITTTFRAFASFDEAFDEHGRLLATATVYAPAMAAWKAGNYEGGVKLMSAHYATAPIYSAALLSIVNGQNLRQYDAQVITAPAPLAAVPTPKPDPIIQAWQQELLDAATKEGKPNPLPKYGADGFGGVETQTALKSYQQNHGLPITGQFDDATRTALNPVRPHVATIPLPIVEFALETALNTFLPPSPEKAILMNFLPTIVQWVVSLLPGIPDDLAKVNAELKELASTDSGVAKIRSAIAFGRAFLNEAERVVNEIDPTGVVAASAPIPPAVAALAPIK